jgi:hypothetical protein
MTDAYDKMTRTPSERDVKEIKCKKYGWVGTIRYLFAKCNGDKAGRKPQVDPRWSGSSGKLSRLAKSALAGRASLGVRVRVWDSPLAA